MTAFPILRSAGAVTRLRVRRAVGAALMALSLSGCVVAVANDGPRPSHAAAAPADPLPAFQWLYGSGEAGAAYLQTFRAISGYAVERAIKRLPDSVVLAEGSPLAASPVTAVRFVPCTGKPNAVIFDADETLILNAGYAYWQSRNGRAFDAVSWDEWERTGGAQVVAAPGAIEAVARLRAAAIVPIVVSNRNAANAAATADALERAGLGRFVHGETMFLKGDDATGSSKDARRARIAARYCVLAMAGDNLGDFSDLFNAHGLASDERRMHVVGVPIEGGVTHLWGDGWFMLPNPTYGPALAGDIDTIFPAALRWEPQQGNR